MILTLQIYEIVRVMREFGGMSICTAPIQRAEGIFFLLLCHIHENTLK